MLFDTHTHYDDNKYDDDRYEVIQRAHERGVSYILNASSSPSSVSQSIAIAERFDFVYAAVGIHPHNAEEVTDSLLETIAGLAANDRVVAIGEIGLDYHYDFSPRSLQQHWFAKQIRLAKEVGLPIVIHNRESHEDMLRIIKDEDAGSVGGVLHCYSGSIEMARKLLDNNFYISVGGPVTFKNARKVIEVVKYVPVDRLLIETDCPYLAPEPLRGKRNESSYIRFVAEKIAQIKGIGFEEIARVTTENAKRLFKIE
jgi:TatD DNase family protein